MVYVSWRKRVIVLAVLADLGAIDDLVAFDDFPAVCLVSCALMYAMSVLLRCPVFGAIGLGHHAVDRGPADTKRRGDGRYRLARVAHPTSQRSLIACEGLGATDALTSRSACFSCSATSFAAKF